MKPEQQGQLEISELKVRVEKQLITDLEIMAKNSGMSIDELVSIAVKRFRSSHADYMGIDLDYP